MKKFEHERGIIAKKTESTNYNLFHLDGGRWLGMAPAWYIEDHEDWQEVKDYPILTTEDGVELFEGDRCYWVWKEAPTEFQENYIITKDDPEEDVLYFNTREAAEDYRLWHFRGLSLKDLNDNCDIYEDHFKNVEELVKSRLK